MFNPPIQRTSRTADNNYEMPPSPRPDEHIPTTVSDVCSMNFDQRYSVLFLTQVSLQTDRKHPVHSRVISVEEDIRRLFQECKVGRGNADLLSETLKFAKPEDLKEREIVKASHHLTPPMHTPTMKPRNFTLDVGLLRNLSSHKFLGQQLVQNDLATRRLSQPSNIVWMLHIHCHPLLTQLQKSLQRQPQRSVY
jgi:hypothetical protein